MTNPLLFDAKLLTPVGGLSDLSVRGVSAAKLVSLALLSLILSVGCGSSEEDDPDGGDGTGGAGADPDENGGATGGSSGVDPSGVDPLALPEVPCSEEQLTCNGECLAPGESSEGCHYLLSDETRIGHIALGDTEIYAAVSGDQFMSSIVSFDKTTPQASTEIFPIEQYETVGGLAVSDTHVGWLQDGESFDEFDLYSGALSGGTPSVVISGEINGFYGTPDGWLVRMGEFNTDDALTLVPFDGGAPVVIGEGSDWLSHSLQHVVDGYFYFDRPDFGEDSTVWRHY